MPTLALGKASSAKKSGKLSQSYSSFNQRQQKNRWPNSSTLRGVQSNDNVCRGSANTSFELEPSARSNAQFDLLTDARGLETMPSLHNISTPSANVFALNAQEILATHGGPSSSKLPLPTFSQSSNAPLFSLNAQQNLTPSTNFLASNVQRNLTPNTNVLLGAQGLMPSAYVFALNTQNMMAAHATTSSSNVPTPVTSQDNFSPSFASNIPIQPISNFTLNNQEMTTTHALTSHSNTQTFATTQENVCSSHAASIQTPTNFAINTEEKLATPAMTSSANLPIAPITSQDNISSSIGAEIPIPDMGQPLQPASLMTEEEERELTDFLGTFAETLPPSIEDDTGRDSLEPDSVPDLYHVNHK